eukprot:scaffold328176_cov72-Tisochrysis_lutea.AAC.1
MACPYITPDRAAASARARLTLVFCTRVALLSCPLLRLRLPLFLAVLFVLNRPALQRPPRSE